MKKFIWVLLLFCVLWKSDCKAWTPPKGEDTSKFLNWYEDNKNVDGAVYKLSGDMTIREEDVVILDGNGKVTIDCGMHGIIIDSETVLDNPNLEIRGEFFFLIMLRGDVPLTLSQGTLIGTGDQVNVIHVSGGKLYCPSGKGAFHIQAKGNDVSGITFTSLGEATLSNLNIDVEGNKSAKGVYAASNVDLSIDNCNIEAKGTRMAYGLYTNINILIKDSTIVAKALAPETICYGVYTEKGTIQSNHSVVEPAGTSGNEYIIAEQNKTRPVYVGVKENPNSWKLPENLEVYAIKGGEKELITVPVIWDLNKGVFEAPGYCIIKGKFKTDTSDQEVINSRGIVPQITILCLPENRIFPIAYEIYPSDTEKNGVLVLIPYPFDADYLGIEYSLDGENYCLYNEATDSNMISKEDTLPDTGMIQLYMRLPQSWQEVYVRFIVKGDSLFSGTSNIWKLTIGGGSKIPENIGDGSGGDRGGQDAETPGTGVEEGEIPDNNNSTKEPTVIIDGQGIQRERVKASSGTTPSKESKDKAVWGQAVSGDEGKSSRNKREAGNAVKEYIPTVDNNSDEQLRKAEKRKESRQWFHIAGVMSSIIVVGGIGIWCGRKIFKKWQAL